jgi:hypothetical protein
VRGAFSLFSPASPLICSALFAARRARLSRAIIARALNCPAVCEMDPPSAHLTPILNKVAKGCKKTLEAKKAILFCLYMDCIQTTNHLNSSGDF